MKYISLAASFLWLIAGFSAGFAQDAVDWTQSQEREVYGSNDYLFSGQVYLPEYRGADGHPFYRLPDWQVGRIYLRDQASPEIRLMYNLVTQRVVVFHKPTGAPPVSLTLPIQMVDSFRIAGELFVRDQYAGEGISEAGFVQQIYQGGFAVYRSINKRYTPNSSGMYPIGTYGENEVRFWVHMPDQDDWQSFSSPRSMIKFLTEDNRDLRKAVKKARRQEVISLKSPSLSQLTLLLKMCDE